MSASHRNGSFQVTTAVKRDFFQESVEYGDSSEWESMKDCVYCNALCWMYRRRIGEGEGLHTLSVVLEHVLKTLPFGLLSESLATGLTKNVHCFSSVLPVD